VPDVVQRLIAGLVYVPGSDNVSTNARLWDAYAAEWNPAGGWCARMAARVGRASPADVPVVGAEWSDEASLAQVLDEFALPHLGPGTVAAEIGSGGGRIAVRLLPHVASLRCFDISARMLERCRQAVHRLCAPEIAARASYVHIGAGQGGAPTSPGAPAAAPRASAAAPSGAPSAPAASAPLQASPLGPGVLPVDLAPSGAFDVVVVFDVLVHCDAHVQYAYFKELARMLRRSDAGGGHAPGRALISTANLLAPDGWARFQAQRSQSVGGFCCE
jgi:SAM-dependent methyltransferase